MPQAAIGGTIIIHKTPHAYSSHVCITRLLNGTWLAAFSQTIQSDPYKHPPGDPLFRDLTVRSSDQGRSWDQPRVVPDYDWYGVEVPGIAQISTGEVLLNQWRFLWFPLELARKLTKSRERQCCFRDVRAGEWRPAQSDADWEAHPYPYARADGGAYVHIIATAVAWVATHGRLVVVVGGPTLACASDPAVCRPLHGSNCRQVGKCT